MTPVIEWEESDMSIRPEKDVPPSWKPIFIDGRPDLDWYRNRIGPQFGVTKAKKFPKYVYAAGGNGLLMHKIANVDLHWWDVENSNRLVRRYRPCMIAHTICGQIMRLAPGRSHSCQIPDPKAVLCNRCHGKTANFPKNGKHEIPKREAHDRLACIAAEDTP